MAPVGAFYNEHDPFAAAWLRELIKGGHIADGVVDERSILDVQADDVRGFTQCHFFAGIGGWSYALRLAGWDDARPVWTGSCPCQPFSSAGKKLGGRDDRHLWPHWARLIRECRPVTIFGEQVEGAIGHGWLDAVFDDLEGEGYACGASCLPAAIVGAPHIRQRLWFVASTFRADADVCEANRRHFDLSIRGKRCEANDEEMDDTSRTVWAHQPRPPIVVDGVSSSVELVCAYGKSCTSVESFLKRFVPGVCPVCDRAIVSHTTQALEDCVKRKREGQTLSAEREKRDKLMRELAESGR